LETTGVFELVIRREAAQDRWLERRWHLKEVAFSRRGDGLKHLILAGGRARSGGLPILKAGAHFLFQGRPGGGQQVSCGIGKAEAAVVLDLIGGAGEEVKLFAGAGGGHVKNASLLLGFALAINPIHPLLGCAAICALALKRRDEELGNLPGVVRLLESAFEPAKHIAAAAASAGLQIGHNHHLEFQAFGLVNGH
jgi:hypothetical protein